ncbi:hypothetical protein EON82_18925 [bacterium]|nr:MAG: hypothetical protein EON82_18925 [bacterium]
MDLLPIRKRTGRSLPHWTSDGIPNFVTMRRGDALPAALVQEYWDEISFLVGALERRLGREATEFERSDIRRKCAGRVERYLDAGHGSCVLKNPIAASIAQKSITMYDGGRYDLHAWCVMHNHAHLILTPLNGWSLEKITYDMKHGSSRLINRAIGRRGRLWQNESFDHLVRNEVRLERFTKYVLDSPLKAGLHDWPFVGSRDTSREGARAPRS